MKFLDKVILLIIILLASCFKKEDAVKPLLVEKSDHYLLGTWFYLTNDSNYNEIRVQDSSVCFYSYSYSDTSLYEDDLYYSELREDSIFIGQDKEMHFSIIKNEKKDGWILKSNKISLEIFPLKEILQSPTKSPSVSDHFFYRMWLYEGRKRFLELDQHEEVIEVI